MATKRKVTPTQEVIDVVIVSMKTSESLHQGDFFICTELMAQHNLVAADALKHDITDAISYESQNVFEFFVLKTKKYPITNKPITAKEYKKLVNNKKDYAFNNQLRLKWLRQLRAHYGKLGV